MKSAHAMAGTWCMVAHHTLQRPSKLEDCARLQCPAGTASRTGALDLCCSLICRLPETQSVSVHGICAYMDVGGEGATPGSKDSLLQLQGSVQEPW